MGVENPRVADATPRTVTGKKPSRPVLNVALWTLQALLAVAFGLSGAMKAFVPIAELSINVPWAADMQVALVRFIGISELVGAVGLLLPGITRIRPHLTAWAALALTLVMVLAVVFHLVRGEPAGAATTAFLGLLAALTAWGRFRTAPL